MDKLTVIQIMGIVISGMGGLVATFTDTRTKNKKRLTKSGWWAISLIAAGIALGGIGQVIANLESKSDAENVMERLEQQKSNSDAIVSNLRQQYMLATNSLAELERQSILAGKSLDELQRVNTRFEQVTVRHAIYRLPDSAPVVAALSDFLDQCVSQKEINPTNNAYPEIKRCVYTREHNVASPTGDGESNLYVIENLASYQSAFRTNIPELRQINELLKSLLAPNLVLRLSKEPLDRRIAEDRNNDHISQLEDFSAEGSRPKREETSLVYSPLTKKIFVHWKDFAFPKEQWQITGKIVSIQDLGKAHCYFNVYGRGNMDETDVYEDMLPRLVEVGFDSHSITTDNFHLYTKYNAIMETMLPTTEKILNGESYSEVDWP